MIDVTTLYGLDAAVSVWRLLHKEKLNILDAIEVSPNEDGRTSRGIGGWYFTATDGTVKSKLQQRWNYESVLDRSMLSVGSGNKYPYTNIAAHFFERESNKWTIVSSNEHMRHVLDMSYSKGTAVVCLAHLNLNQCGDAYFTVKHDVNAKNPIAPPKFQLHSMYNNTNDEQLNKTQKLMSAIPSRLIVCKSKYMIRSVKTFTSELISIIERKLGKGFKVKHIELVIMTETVLISAEDMLSDESSKKIWLHHVQCLSFENTNTNKAIATTTQNTSSNVSNSDMISRTDGSLASSKSKLTTASRALSKTGLVCIGDFCYYDPTDPENDPSFTMDEEDEDFDVKV